MKLKTANKILDKTSEKDTVKTNAKNIPFNNQDEGFNVDFQTDLSMDEIEPSKIEPGLSKDKIEASLSESEIKPSLTMDETEIKSSANEIEPKTQTFKIVN